MHLRLVAMAVIAILAGGVVASVTRAANPPAPTTTTAPTFSAPSR